LPIISKFDTESAEEEAMVKYSEEEADERRRKF